MVLTNSFGEFLNRIIFRYPHFPPHSLFSREDHRFWVFYNPDWKILPTILRLDLRLQEKKWPFHIQLIPKPLAQILIGHGKPTYAGKMQCQIDKGEISRQERDLWGQGPKLLKVGLQLTWPVSFSTTELLALLIKNTEDYDSMKSIPRDFPDDCC